MFVSKHHIKVPHTTKSKMCLTKPAAVFDMKTIYCKFFASALVYLQSIFFFKKVNSCFVVNAIPVETGWGSCC